MRKSFVITYTAECRDDEAHFVWDCVITGKEDSSLAFRIDGLAHQSFLRNRLGFTVLHSAESVSGLPVQITHEDDTTEELRFPALVSPHQPFVDIKAMKWSPAPGMHAELAFEGDLFETEDQRNWLDATFKTYCTPLVKPFPHRVRKGDTVHQVVNFKTTAHESPSRSVEQSVSFYVDTIRLSALPEIGIPLSSLEHSDKHVELIKGLAPDFIRVRVNTARGHIETELKKAERFNLPIEVALFVDDELDTNLLDELIPFAKIIRRIILLPDYRNSTDSELIEAFVPELRKHFPAARIGGGTDAFFTELNRERTPAAALDFLSFSVTPQAHASDLRTIVENLATHKDVVSSCREFAGGKDVEVGPVTFKIRWNPAAASNEEHVEPGKLPASADLRHRSLFGAGWTIASIKNFAESEVKAVTYYETCGWKGIMKHPDQPWPGVEEDDATVYPLFIALRLLLNHRDAKVAKFVTTDPLRMDGIAFLHADGKQCVLVANFTNDVLPVTLPYTSTWNLRVIDENNLDEILLNPIDGIGEGKEVSEAFELAPFGVAVLRAGASTDR